MDSTKHFDIFFANKEWVKEFDPVATDEARDADLALWESLWSKPQALTWARLRLEYVAAYVRVFIELTGPN